VNLLDVYCTVYINPWNVAKETFELWALSFRKCHRPNPAPLLCSETHTYINCILKLPAIPQLPPHPPDLTSVASTDNSQRSLNSSISRFSSSEMRPTRLSLLRVFFFFPLFFSKEPVLLCLSCGRLRITQTLGPRARGILPSLRTLTNEAERTLDLTRRRSRQGKSPWLSTE